MPRHGVGTRRESHRFVVVVYGREGAEPATWPGNAVHVAGPAALAVEADEAVRVPFERLDRVAEVLRDLIEDARAGAPSREPVEP